MGQITIDQSHAVMQVLATNVDWSKVDPIAVQEIIRDTKSSGENFAKFLNNRGKLQIIGNHEINTDATPRLPFDGATIEYHKKDGKMILDPSKINLYLSEGQKGGQYIEGNKLRKELKSKPVLNACVLDYLLDNPHLIPEEWKGKAVFFWGTIFRGSDGSLYVRYLYWDVGRWQAYYRWLGNDFRALNPAAVSAS